VLKKLSIVLFLLACGSPAYADSVPETYSVYIFWNRFDYASATFTAPDGFIDAPTWIPCSELSSFEYTLALRQVGCGAGLFLAQVEGGLSVQISSRRQSLVGGFFAPADEDGTFIISPDSPSFLTITDPNSVSLPTDPAVPATPEPPFTLILGACVSLLLAIKVCRN
jgi:hypothetical protein